MKMSPPRQTGLLGAVRPQTPHRSPWQAFGGNFQHGLPAASSGKTNTPKLFSLHDYMPVDLRVGPNERKLDGPESRRLTDVRRGGSFRERGLREQGGIGQVIKGLRVILYPQSGSVTGDEKI